MDTPALLPCPFCGSADVSIRTDLQSSIAYVVCGDCDAQGPPAGFTEVSSEEQDAAIYWNQRSAVGNCPELKNLVTAIDAEYHPESQGQHFTTELCNAIDAARAAVDNPPSSAWQPIETAPKDETEILAWDGEKRYVAYFWGDSWWSHGDDGGDFFAYPTHWQPLPSPPPITP